MKYFSLCFYFLIPLFSFSQTTELNIFRITSSNTSFPDTARAKGHVYNKILYDASTHYMDSSVMIITPKNLKADKKVDIVFWFHGWGNNIDSAAIRYALIKQFADANLNAVLVFPETARNAPDSYGGKLEYNNTFKRLVSDVLKELKKQNTINKNCETGNILLAGHSGAYRVMAYILQNGGMPVQEVILFDALYSQTDKFTNWIKENNRHRFIDIFTDSGGTDAESREMEKQLIAANIEMDSIEESDLTVQFIQAKRIFFIHSLHEHNDIINDPDNFRAFLENSPFLKKRRR
jgi:predicted esterase